MLDKTEPCGNLPSKLVFTAEKRHLPSGGAVRWLQVQRAARGYQLIQGLPETRFLSADPPSFAAEPRREETAIIHADASGEEDSQR